MGFTLWSVLHPAAVACRLVLHYLHGGCCEIQCFAQHMKHVQCRAGESVAGVMTLVHTCFVSSLTDAQLMCHVQVTFSSLCRSCKAWSARLRELLIVSLSNAGTSHLQPNDCMYHHYWPATQGSIDNTDEYFEKQPCHFAVFAFHVALVWSRCC